MLSTFACGSARVRLLIVQSSCEPFEREHRGRNHVAQRIKEQSVGLSTIEPKCHLVQVGREMLRADAMPCAHNAALEQRECGFDRKEEGCGKDEG